MPSIWYESVKGVPYHKIFSWWYGVDLLFTLIVTLENIEEQDGLFAFIYYDLVVVYKLRLSTRHIKLSIVFLLINICQTKKNFIMPLMI